MGSAGLTTDRLTLRPLAHADADRIAVLIGNPEVAHWLSAVPLPYTRSDAVDYLRRVVGHAGNWAVCQRSDLIGVVSLRTGLGLGYWLGQPYWGQGLMKEAVAAVLAQRFRQSDRPIISGHHLGNTRSRHLLLGMGFRDADRREIVSANQPDPVTVQRMQLTLPNWHFSRDPAIRTARLVLRPLRAEHADEVASLGNDPDIARMLATVPHPFSVAQAREWIGDNRWRGRPGFRWGIWQQEGPLMGMVAIGGRPANTAYWLGRAFWGQGYATEAMRGFLADMLPRLGLCSVEAEAYVENAASQAVLAKLGFEKTGQGMGDSAARLEPAPVFTYRLDAARLRAGQ